jgi:hypothetical protein
MPEMVTERADEMIISESRERFSWRAEGEFSCARAGYQAPEKAVFLAEMPLNEGKVTRTTPQRRLRGA